MFCRLLEGEGGDLVIEGFWPYWMTEGDPTVRNSAILKGMVLLTGCNMGGKVCCMCPRFVSLQAQATRRVNRGPPLLLS